MNHICSIVPKILLNKYADSPQKYSAEDNSQDRAMIKDETLLRREEKHLAVCLDLETRLLYKKV